MDKIKTGDTLANGAIVLQVRAKGNGEEIVLALWNREFVTWTAVYVADSSETYWGHYFGEDLRAGLEDFETR